MSSTPVFLNPLTYSSMQGNVSASKASELTLCWVPRSGQEVQALSADNWQQTMELSRMALVPRGVCEACPTMLQPIGYACVLDAEGQRVLTYRRPGQEVGDKRLRGKRSLGFGGHTDALDSLPIDSDEICNNIDWPRALHCSLHRELIEELSLNTRGSRVPHPVPTMLLKPSFVRRTKDDYAVEDVHLGFVFEFQLGKTIHPCRMSQTTDEIEGKEWMTWMEALEHLDEFEDWSQQVIRHATGFDENERTQY